MTPIGSLKYGKPRGKDSLNADSSRQSQILQHKLFSHYLPVDWTEGVIVKIPEKGALSNCNKWRVIILPSVPSKILAKLIISEAVDQRLRQEQAGFRTVH